MERIDRRKRLFIKTTAGVGLGLLGASVSRLALEKNRERFLERILEQARDAVRKTLEGAEAEEKIGLTPGYFIPENERQGTDVLLNAFPKLGYNPLRYYDFEGSFQNYLAPILKALPGDTNVHLLIPLETENRCREALQRVRVDLNFHFYEVPGFSDATYPYVQDTFFSTGRREDGAFVLATNDAERAVAKRSIDYYASQGVRELFPFDSRFLEKNYNDEVLIDRYPANFCAKRLDVPLIGGDLNVTKLPDGRTVVFVGSENIENFLNTFPEYSQTLPKGLSLVEFFTDCFSRIKDAYKKALGVDEVIIVDEKHRLASLKEIPSDKPWHFMLAKLHFFHIDMVFKILATKQ